MIAMWIALLAVLLTVLAAVLFFTRRVPSNQLLISQLAERQPKHMRAVFGSSETTSANEDLDLRDTVFILPDISNYTRFMTGNRFAFGHAQHVIFCLINAMIEAACKTVELSKLEGDAALFFVDANKLTQDQLGRTVLDIFAAFFQERARLITSNVCPCSACNQISDLDLKIFMHRGQATRFEFRGAIDHFGTDVIVLHRLMKNSVRGHRYVMITDAAASCIKLPDDFDMFEITEQHEHIGKTHAEIFEISDAAVDVFTKQKPTRLSKIEDLKNKLQQNWRSMLFDFNVR